MRQEMLRRCLSDLDKAIRQLHVANARCDPDALRNAIDDLDLIAADLHVVAEEIAASPPTEEGHGGSENGPAGTAR